MYLLQCGGLSYSFGLFFPLKKFCVLKENNKTNVGPVKTNPRPMPWEFWKSHPNKQTKTDKEKEEGKNLSPSLSRATKIINYFSFLLRLVNNTISLSLSLFFDTPTHKRTHTPRAHTHTFPITFFNLLLQPLLSLSLSLSTHTRTHT